jgi:hypothetical protein
MSDTPDPDDVLPEEEGQEYQPEVVEQANAHNLLDARSVRRQRKRVDNETEQASKFWRELFSTPVGRREMWGLLRAAQPDGNPFMPPFACGPNGFPQPEATWFRAGQYALGQSFYQQWIWHARDGVLLMLDEHDPRFAKSRKRPRQQR